MENLPVHLGFASLASSLDTILENRTTRTSERIRNNSSGKEVVGVENNQVILVIDDALTVAVEVADQVDVGTFCAGTVEPGVSKGDGAVAFGLFFLDKENLCRIYVSMPAKIKRRSKGLLFRVAFGPLH